MVRDYIIHNQAGVVCPTVVLNYGAGDAFVAFIIINLSIAAREGLD